MVLIVTGSGKRTAESFNGSSGQAPLLHIEFQNTVATPSLNLWKFTYFTPAERADPLISAFGANPDGDSSLNLSEYAHDFDPNLSEPAGARLIVVDDGGQSYPALSYSRRKGGTGISGVSYLFESLSYQVRVSSDLINWDSGAAFVEEFSITDDGNGVTETVEIRSEKSLIQEPRQFLELKLQHP